MGTSAVIYARISEDRQDGAGVQRQLDDCRAYAERMDWTVTGEFVDNDISASSFSRKARPAYADMMDVVKAGEAEVVIAYNLDRLWRRPRDLETLCDLADRGVTVATLGGDFDLRTADGRLLARQLCSIAAHQSDRASERIRRQKQQAARDGKRMSGAGTFGYHADGTVNVEQADLIRDMAAWALAGSSPWAIARRLNEKGATTLRGRQWHPTSVRRTLTGPAIAALSAYRGEIVADGQWEPIIDRDTHDKLVRALTPGAAGRERTPRRRQWLTGLVRCGECGVPLRRRNGGPARYLWSCRPEPGRDACGRVHVAAHHLEPLVRDSIFVAVDGASLADTMSGTDSSDPQVTAAAAELDKVNAKLGELAQAYADDQVSMQDWVTARKGLEARAETARARLQRSSRAGAISAYAGQGGALAAVWDGLDVDQQRGIAAAVLDAVVVESTTARRVFDPDRVRFVWAK